MNQENTNLTGKIYVAGTRGYSNYEIAVQNGFVGTEEEWLEKITQDEADIVWRNIQAEIEAGSLTFAIEEDYDEDEESLTLSIIPMNEEENNG